MAMPSSKSSSLAAPPSRSNPNLRNSETSNPIRRSFSGNPFPKPSIIANPKSFNPNTPANSPSDFTLKNSIGGRESVGSFCDLDDKENGKDQNFKPAKVRSPAASKCTKNFMSPTISAASKITAVSPRKKVLIERNEPARTSFSSTDGKSPILKVTFAETVEYSDFRPEVGLEEKNEVPKEETERLTASMISEDLKGEAVLETNVPLNSKNETESSFETAPEEADCVNLDPTFKLSPTPPPVSSTSTIIAPLDADPLIRPYDPKMNYLSPRPQFLHYKPNPRIELYKEREGLKLEDSFISESYSDTEATEETQSEGSQKESEDVSSDEVVNEEHSNISESSPTMTLMPEDIAETKGVPKPGFFSRSKATALLLLLSFACISISVTNPPVFDPTAFKDLSIFSQVYESSEFSEFARANFDRFSELAKANFDGLARNFHIWFTKSMSSISELISRFRGEHNLGPLQYWNLTGLQENIPVDQCPIFGHYQMRIEEALQVEPSVLNVEEIEISTEIYTDEDTGDISTKHYDSAYKEQVQEAADPVPPLLDVEENDAATEIDTHEDSEEQFPLDLGVITEVENASDVFEDQPASVTESEQALQQAEVSEPSHSESNIDYPDRISETAEIHFEVFEAVKLEAKQAPENEANVNVNPKDHPDLNSQFAEILTEDQPYLKNPEVAEVHTENHDGTGHIPLKAEEKSLNVEAVPYMLLPLLLFLSLITGTMVFNWLTKDESRRTRVRSSVAQPQVTKTFQVKSLSSPEEQVSIDKPSLINEPIEMDVAGESCPSEISSFQKSSIYSQKVVKERNEAQSLEKKPKKNYRRESLASSDNSMGSPSYGSFTTYERLSIKQGRGEAETVTPVRRSSRIRQATSPL